MLTEKFETIERELPALIARSQVDRLLAGVVSSRHLANLDCKGEGPAHFRIGRKIIYRREDLLYWLQKRAKEISPKNCCGDCHDESQGVKKW